MDQPLTRILALICICLNPRCRSHFLDLLPRGLAVEVQDLSRAGRKLVADGMSRPEAAVPRVFGRTFEDIDAEVESKEPVSSSEGESGHAEADDVELFFAEGEGLESQGSGAEDVPGETTPLSKLPTTLLTTIMLSADPQKAAQLLVELPLRLQGESLSLIVTNLAAAVAQVLETDERPLFVELIRNVRQRDEWGVAAAVPILRSIDTTRRLRRALEAFAAVDDEAVSILQDQLFQFEDVFRLDDREVQILLARLDNPLLASAMKGASDSVKDRFFGNMSERRSLMLGEEAELLSDLGREEVLNARKQVLDTLRRLYERGDIRTYFGSVQEGAQEGINVEGDEGSLDDGALEVLETSPETPSVSVPIERKGGSKQVASVPDDHSREIRLAAIASLSLAAVVAFVTGLHLLMRDDPRTLQSEGQAQSGSYARSPRSVQIHPAKPAEVRVGIQRERQMVGSQLQEVDSNSKRGIASLRAGEQFAISADDLEAILIMPAVDGLEGDVAQVAVSPGTEIGREGEGAVRVDGGLPGALMMRMGKVRTLALVDGFVVRTPLVGIVARKGAHFVVRVVLDGSTTIRVEGGVVDLQVLSGDGSPLQLDYGDRARFTPDGDREIERES